MVVLLRIVQYTLYSLLLLVSIIFYNQYIQGRLRVNLLCLYCLATNLQLSKLRETLEVYGGISKESALALDRTVIFTNL